MTCGRAPTPSQPSSTTSSSYALTVDGYAYALAVYRRELPGLVEELERRWLEEQGKALTFVELRLLLFWWQRGAPGSSPLWARPR